MVLGRKVLGGQEDKAITLMATVMIMRETHVKVTVSAANNFAAMGIKKMRLRIAGEPTDGPWEDMPQGDAGAMVDLWTVTFSKVSQN